MTEELKQKFIWFGVICGALCIVLGLIVLAMPKKTLLDFANIKISVERTK